MKAVKREIRSQRNYKLPLVINIISYLILICLLFNSCHKTENQLEIINPTVEPDVVIIEPLRYIFKTDIKMGDYLDTMNNLAIYFDSLLNYKITEHIIVHANPWLLDSLAATDYYIKKQQGILIDDPLSYTIFKAGDTLTIPDSLKSLAIQHRINNYKIDINIPEFKLGILEGDSLLFKFPVRVGKPIKKYLAMAGKAVNLRTKTGTGIIVNINKDPDYINPTNNKIYKVTRRDDGIVTKLPRIPWLEPELNGQRHGQLIHPTTNPNTLEKAYSNGCIGVAEHDMWYIYYYSIIGTPITVRYDLEVPFPDGDNSILQDIYPSYSKTIAKQSFITLPYLNLETSLSICTCF